MTIKTKLAALATATILLGTAATANAGHDGGQSRSDRAQYDYAKVLSAEPIVRYVTVTTPVRECWQETRYVDNRYNRRYSRNGPGTLLGAVIGGVIGHQVGSGRGNDAATIAGALIGASVGSQAARQNGQYDGERQARQVERCETTYREEQEERIDGYRVTYRYHGQKYRTEMPYDPGQRIRVRVDVRPAR
jgi:uncharacterized protein YcfJ